MLIQHLNQDRIVVEVSDLAPSNKKSIIRVLHVDDDSSLLEISKQILMDMGSFEIDQACCVDEAFKKLAAGQYDVVISDYEMPQKDGLQFLTELREQKYEIPFILFTGKGREEVAVNALNLGADGYINKIGDTETVYGELSHGIRLAAERMKAKSALEESEKRYRTLMEQAAEAIFVHDINGQVVDVNQQACISLGYTKKELLSMDIAEIDAEATENKKGGLFWSKILAGQSVTFESTHKRKDGSTFPVEVTLGPTTLGKETLVIGLVRNITKRNLMDVALQKSNERFKQVMEHIEEFVWEVDAAGVYTYVSSAVEKMLGYKPEEVVGKKRFYDFFHPDDEEELKKKAFSVLDKKDSFKGLINRNVARNGSVVWLSTSGVPIVADDGKLLGYRGVDVNITERTKAEEALKQERDKLESVTATIGAGLVIVSKDYHVLWANNFIRRYKGDVEGKLCYATLNTLDAPCPDCGVAKIFAGKTTIDAHEYCSTTIDGKLFWVEIVATPITDENGNVISAVEVTVDITEKKLLQQKLLANEAKFRAINESANDAIFMFDEEDRITYWNPAAERIFGYTEKEVVGEKVNETIVPFRFRRDHLKLTEELGKVENKKNAGEIQEFLAFRKDGTEFSMELSMAPLQLEGKQYIVAIARDITDRKRTEELLKDSVAKYRDFAESLPEIVFEIDAKGTLVFVNQRASQITGYSQDEFGNNFSFIRLVVPDEREKAIANIKRLLSGETVGSNEYNLVKKDGAVFPVMIWATSRIVQNKVAGLRGIVVDISEHKKAEEHLKESHYKMEMMNEKLRVVGALTRHDVRNKLSAVTGNAYLLKKKHADQADIVDVLGKMEQAIKDVVAIFDFTKMYEQLGVEELKYVDAERTINEAVALFGDLSFKVVNDCHGLSLLADSFLRQLFYNFIDNTRKYGQKTTAIRVYYEKAEQGELRLVYLDDGVGISAENKLRLFIEGFSTGGSTGFGLFLTKKMMDVYGWEIEENGEPGI
ncbi:PAS domain S-box protein, partial [Candidatus Bathyarchaeota archaeon]|nr:PAS domain S-box protein [Candidatus Bathyarchaeota archaeon]